MKERDAMEKVGVLCASDTELAPFLEAMEVERVTEKARLRFYEGALGERPAVAAYSGVCKVNAAVAAELLIEVFGVDAVVNAERPEAWIQGSSSLTRSSRSARFTMTWRRIS